MKPNDLIKTTLRTGFEKVWQITAVIIGGENQEGVVEMRPVGMLPHSEKHPTRCPMDILEDAIANGTTSIFNS